MHHFMSFELNSSRTVYVPIKLYAEKAIGVFDFFLPLIIENLVFTSILHIALQGSRIYPMSLAEAQVGTSGYQCNT